MPSPPPEDDAPDSGETFDFGENVEASTFDQILEMDEDDDGEREFSSSIVFDFLQQAENTIKQMKIQIENEELEALAASGHFLKGSSATLGFIHIRDACEKIQHYGQLKAEDGTTRLERDVAIQKSKESIQDAGKAYEIVKALMERFYARV